MTELTPKTNNNGRNYRLETIKQLYQQNNQIESLMNPSKSFPIEPIYLNLSIVESKQQQEKKKNDSMFDRVMNSSEHLKKHVEID